MAGVAGILIPDVLTHAGLLNVPVWYEQGLVAQQGSFAPFSARPTMLRLLFRGWGLVVQQGSFAPYSARPTMLRLSCRGWGLVAQQGPFAPFGAHARPNSCCCRPACARAVQSSAGRAGLHPKVLLFPLVLSSLLCTCTMMQRAGTVPAEM